MGNGSRWSGVLTLALAGLVALFSACGGGAAAPTAAPPAPPAASPASPAAAPAPTTAPAASPAASPAPVAASPASATSPVMAASPSAAASASPAVAASPSPAALASPAAAGPPANPEIILATTTSTQDSGLLDVLVPMFEQASGYHVKTIAVGTGQALELGARGEADVVLVHAPESEEQWFAAGNGTVRLLVMHNDFILVGPPADPAGSHGKPIDAALRAIADQGKPFASRADNSGTDQLEKKLWRTLSLDPKGQSWYLEVGQGMGQTLTVASERDAYTITDRATYLARKSTLRLDIMVEGDPALLNIYHVMPVNPARFPKVNAAGGDAFARFMVAPDTQRVIADFGRDKFGQSLFFPDAGKPEPTTR